MSVFGMSMAGKLYEAWLPRSVTVVRRVGVCLIKSGLPTGCQDSGQVLKRAVIEF
jgi:hypothetical protein